MQETVQEIIRRAEDNYLRGTTHISEHVDWSMHDTLETIDAYYNSKHVSGPVDSLGREKPFFNVVVAVANIWTRATDIDRKDIKIKASRSEQETAALVATAHLQQWMRKERFGVFLNQWGRNLAKYGSSVVKFVRKDGRLIPSVVPWNRLIVDPVDFNALPVIEKVYMTPAQLRQNKAYYKDAVKDLINSAVQSRETLDGQTKDNLSEFIEVYEVHGELPLSYLTGNEEDEETYKQQMHVVSFVETKPGEYQDFCLYKGKEEKSPYMLTHLMEEDGRTLGIGAVEYLFDAQWMMNHTMKAQKDYLDLASRIMYQTADANYVGRNVLSAVETGDIMVYAKDTQGITQVNNSTPNMGSLVEYGQQWKLLAQEITSTPEALRGTTMPSGTPYSLGALLSQQAGSLFEYMLENKGLHIEDMAREHIIPFIKTKMDTSEEIAAELNAQGIAKLDAMYVPREAIKRHNKKVVDDLLNEEIPSPYNPMEMEGQVKSEMAAWGDTRYLKPSDISTKTWKEVVSDLEWEVDVEVTNEMLDKQAELQTLSTVFHDVLQFGPVIEQSDDAKYLLGQILHKTSTLSPLQLPSNTRAPRPMNPAMNPAMSPTPQPVNNLAVK